ncbi:hypothetical protein L1987_81994 [Smallanthus sonchifolius]|uniref:Uncharacterized protein n=1 Tax=Smallanthus sonchifolius TaxID=185202 RepID=A0ACB8YSM1_9ASTR|nr:hypothetical protein L1987_81994 [Smallanthus sonchifolius]
MMKPYITCGEYRGSGELVKELTAGNVVIRMMKELASWAKLLRWAHHRGENKLFKRPISNYMSKHTRLIVEERVLKRTISDVRYRLSDSRIYQDEILEADHAYTGNESPDKDSTTTLTLKMSKSRTTSWNNSVSVKVGVKLEFETSIVPLIEKGKVEVSTEIGYAHEWGGSTTTTTEREVSYAVVVPPLTKMKVSLMCTKGACVVPFSYKQRDLLPGGRTTTTIKDDGIYSGINSYNFYCKSSKVDS